MHDDHGEARPPVDDTFTEIEGLEQYTLTSVGVDIGSSTSHVVISRLTLRRRGSDLSTEFVVTDREILFVSAPLLTPYSTPTRMDVAQLEHFVRECYAAADLTPEHVDTGVVVITGEALNKENAEEIANAVSGWSGDFICVSAGANHEAVLAAHGSGSVALSAREECTVLNIDIGGGTTKVSLIRQGTIVHREAFSVGARLVAWDAEGRITRLEDVASVYARHTGIPLRMGQVLHAEDIDRLADLMAQVVIDVVIPGPLTDVRRELMVTPADEGAAPGLGAIDRIVFSGGVAEYIEARESTSFGDLGPSIGTHVRRHLHAAGLDPMRTSADHGIRATVIGASQFSVQASGQTCYISDASLLPVRGLPVAQVELSPCGEPGAAIDEALRRHDRRDLSEGLAFAVRFQGARTYSNLRRYASALVAAADGNALHLVLRDDLALSLGRLIVTELGHSGPVVVVDGITVGDLDYIDIGHPMGSTRSIPVTVKSLAFPHHSTPSPPEEN